MLWFGWFGFNAGSALAAGALATEAFATTNTASAAAMMAWMALEHIHAGKPTASGACVGAVVGLVAITPAAGFVTVGESICSFGAVLLKRKLNIDDTLDVFPCHGVGGIVGTILTGVFAKDVGLTSGHGKTFGYQWLCVLIVFAWSFTISLILYYLVNFLYPLRVTDEEEFIGLDLSQHGESIGPMVIVHPMQRQIMAREMVEPVHTGHNYPTHMAAAGGYPTSPFPNQMPMHIIDTNGMQSLVDPRLNQDGLAIVGYGAPHCQ
jgi:Amt family ammonium transporter